LRGDDGFEDREGHQAPFTLPIADCGSQIAEGKENVVGSTSNIRRRITNMEAVREIGVQIFSRIAGSLFDLFDRRDDDGDIRPVAGVEFGMEQFAIGANLESAAARGNQRERLDALAELKNFGRQTDGLRRVVSNYAVFDRYLGFHQRAPFRERKYRCDQMRSRNANGCSAGCGKRRIRNPGA
jgi:hypothetical protein